MDCSTSGSSVLHCLPEFGQIQAIESVMLSNHLILCSPHLLPSVFPSIRVFSSELALCIRWPNIEISASASVLPVSIEGWFSLGLTGPSYSPRESKVQHHNSKASILWHSAFFMAQLSHLYMTIGKTIVLIIQTFGKVVSLLFNTLARFVDFFPRSKCLLNSKKQASFNLMAAVTIHSDFGAQENSLSLFPLFPRLFAWSVGTGCHELSCFFLLLFCFLVFYVEL